MSNERIRLLIIGAVLGTVVGLLAAWIATDADKEKNQRNEAGELSVIRPSAKQWVSLAVAVISLLRLYSEMMTPKVEKS